MSNIPKLDGRDYAKILKEIEYLAKQYTPEWNYDENSPDVGVVFAKVFSTMMESTISRYNKTTYNHYLMFLNMLGTKLRPAASSSGMVVVKAAANSDGAFIDKGTALFADADTDEGSVVYETMDGISVVDTAIKSIYFTEPKSDFIGKVFANPDADSKIKIEPFRIFDNVFYNNLQSHEIYFKDNIVFNMSKSDITFLFFNNLSAIGQEELPKVFADPENVSWQYYDEKEWKTAESVEMVPGGVRIKFPGTTNPFILTDEPARYIRCKFKKIPEEGLALTGVKYKTTADQLAIDNAVSNDAQLAKNDYFPFEEQYTIYNSFHIACNEAFTKKGSMIELTAQMQFVKVKIDAKNPGKKYKFIMSAVDFTDLEPEDIEIEKVKWEYWNGSGWAKLISDDSYEDFFKVRNNSEDNESKDKSENSIDVKADQGKNKEEKAENKEKIEDVIGQDTKRTMKFRCPDDLERINIGPSQGYFIRARISKMKNIFDVFANYITPYIHDISVKYNYEGDGHACDKVIVHSDMKKYEVKLANSGIAKLLERSLCPSPAMYFCLNRPLVQGMIRIFIDVEEGIHRYNPAVKWEYLADDHKGGSVWKHIDVMDGTDGFSHSESITLIGKNDFKEETFLDNKGYFIRITNPDMHYSNTENIAGRPVISDIKFNAVRVIQSDTRAPEFFSIEQDEENKLCKLSYPNAAQLTVWVDELGKISTNEQEKFLKMPKDKAEPEYDELGNLEKLWIKWESVPNIVAYGMHDRVYEVDYPKGEVRFGNGRNGKIPPEQYNESIRINYSICHGSKGNIDAEQVKDFVGSIVNIESVTNPSPIMGGLTWKLLIVRPDVCLVRFRAEIA